MQKRITISFTKADEDIYEFLETKPNISRFVCDSIRATMSKDDHDARIAGIVAKMLAVYTVVDSDDELKQLAETFEL